MIRKADIMGIGRIEVAFDGLEYRSRDIKVAMSGVSPSSVRDESGDGDEWSHGQESMGRVCLYTVLPQKTKIMDDQLLLNKVGAEMHSE